MKGFFLSFFLYTYIIKMQEVKTMNDNIYFRTEKLYNQCGVSDSGTEIIL